ncbi:MAG: histidine--tRNA ligase [Planctomycetota bacterium]|nr:histidine--tRNA ligase [Planctomycetota bacterium]
MRLKKPQGTEDILPEQIPLWRYLEDTVRNTFERYNYSEIRTPIMEFYSLFNRSIGETTDIIEKEMYFLRTREHEEGTKDLLTLRPELTAPIVRAYLEHNFDKTRSFQKWYYYGPLFRHERPQKGRLRQFHQIGVEVLGSYDAFSDVEVIDLAMTLLRLLGINDCQLDLNSMGCPDCRKTYSKALREALEGSVSKLCENCQQRFNKNILRILDCKDKRCYEISFNIASLDRYLCQRCNEHFRKVKKGLEDNRIAYRLNNRLVRGFDYYTKTVFEITHSGLGAQNALCGGGRYDGLIAQFGGPPTGAVGFAMGVERIIEVLAAKKRIEPRGPSVYLAVTDESLKSECYKLLRELRENLVSAEMDYEQKSLKAQFRNADRIKARFVAVLGTKELSKGTVTLKEMATGKEREVELKSLVETIKE